MFYTSNFASLRFIPKDLTPVSIARYSPKWYQGYEYKRLAPSPDILMEYKACLDIDRYIYRYNREILDYLDPVNIFRDIRYMTFSEDIVLLCYERSTDFCHRHLVAEWFRNSGIPCEEWRKSK